MIKDALVCLISLANYQTFRADYHAVTKANIVSLVADCVGFSYKNVIFHRSSDRKRSVFVQLVMCLAWKIIVGGKKKQYLHTCSSISLH